jgi:predicted acylesterase/phospholipase RssA
MTQERGDTRPKRALILAGGGMKVAWQAGVLQVWLDEAGLEFDVFDGASGGVFQLAMLCQGMSGTQIADNWRRADPGDAVAFNLAELPKLVYAESLFTLDGLRQKMFRDWGLDWEKIRASDRDATFNVYNFSRHRLEVLGPAQMTEDLLCACVSLPMWFPPVLINGDHYIDAVYATDANLEEAIRRGADELWVIWTVSQRGVWNSGFVATYFQIIEAAANGRYRAVLDRIDSNNRAIAGGRPGEFGRHIEVKELRGEVPLHYILDLSADRFREAVEMGVRAARQWCVLEGLPLGQPAEAEAPDATTLSFTEEMKGFVGLGETDFEGGYRAGMTRHTALMVHLTITVQGVISFVTHPEQTAAAEGYVRCDALGGELPVEEGIFNLFVDEGDPTHKRMLYRLFFTSGGGAGGRQLTLSGFKEIRDGPGFDAWRDTTTLFTRVLEGHVPAEAESTATVVASGIITIHLLDFLHQLTTFRVTGGDELGKASALGRFGTFFLGKLWDVYGQRVLSYGPW